MHLGTGDSFASGFGLAIQVRTKWKGQSQGLTSLTFNMLKLQRQNTHGILHNSCYYMWFHGIPQLIAYTITGAISNLSTLMTMVGATLISDSISV